MNPLALFQSIHGHIAVLVVAATIHPPILLRRGAPLTRGSSWAIATSAVLTLLTYGLGLFLYPDYRAFVKQSLFSASMRAGLLFETKEHLAFFVLSLTLAACVAAFAAPKSARRLRQAAAVLFGLASISALLTFVLGVYVASVRDFSSAAAIRAQGGAERPSLQDAPATPMVYEP